MDNKFTNRRIHKPSLLTRPEYSEDIHAIIYAPPKWLLQWGILLFFFILIIFLGLSAFISYPDTIRARFVIKESAVSQFITARTTGEIGKILISNGQVVHKGQMLALIDSNPSAEQIFKLLARLKRLQKILLEAPIDQGVENQFSTSDLGTISGSYTIFLTDYMVYKQELEILQGTDHRRFFKRDGQKMPKWHANNPTNFKKKLDGPEFSVRDQVDRDSFKLVKKIRTNDKLALTALEVDSGQGKNIVLNSQNESINALMPILQQKAKLLGSLKALIADVEIWKTKFILWSPGDGKALFVKKAKNNFVIENEPVFVLQSGNDDLFGQLFIPLKYIRKVKRGQKVRVSLESFPYEDFGMLSGTIKENKETGVTDKEFVSIVNINKRVSGLKGFQLKNGMIGSAEIILNDESFLSRIGHSLKKSF